MTKVLLVVWFSLFGFSSCADRNQDGLLKTFEGYTFRPYDGNAKSFLSNGFPNQVPHRLLQTGRYGCAKKYPDEPTAMRFTCPVIDVPKSADGSCTTKVFIQETESRKTINYCGLYKDVTVVLPVTDVLLEIATGEPSGGGLVNCTVDCVWLKPDGEVQPPTPHPYLTHEFEEEDSSEHGFGPASRPTSCPCGMANKVSSRIVNGTVTLPNEFPFIAAVIEKKKLWQFCGGSIITAFHVLTAAHCTAGRLNVPLGVRVGAHDLREKPKLSDLISVVKIIQHKGYNPREYNAHDIAILVLKKEIKFSPFVGRVCLPTTQLNLAHQNAKIIGWGANRFMGPGSDILQKVNARILTMEECKLETRDIPIENPIHLCTYRTSKGSCQGDSGGPVVWLDRDTNRYTLIGAVSFGRICGDHVPSYHTDVGAHLPWIHQTIRESGKDGTICNKV